MKQIALVFGLVILSYSCGNRGDKDMRTIQFEIYNTSQYCGGAPPDEEMQKDLNTPKPTNDTFYIYDSPDRMGDPVQLVVNKGKGEIPYLNEGEYMAFRFSPDHMKKMERSPDPMAGCYMDYYRRMYFTFEVKPETEMISDTVHFQCDPCVPPAP